MVQGLGFRVRPGGLGLGVYLGFSRLEDCMIDHLALPQTNMETHIVPF